MHVSSCLCRCPQWHCMFQTRVCPILEGSQYHSIRDSEQPSATVFISHLPPDIFQLRLCLFWKCLGTFDLLLFASFSPQSRHTGKTLSSEANANAGIINILFSSDIFLFLPFFILGLPGLESCDKCKAFWWA